MDITNTRDAWIRLFEEDLDLSNDASSAVKAARRDSCFTIFPERLPVRSASGKNSRDYATVTIWQEESDLSAGILALDEK
jgi:hypothetical protein